MERSVVEKKTPSHGPDFGLEPDRGPDGKSVRDSKTGKHRAKQNKKNYEKFVDNVEEFMRDSKTTIEKHKFYRKGLESEQPAIVFINHDEKRFTAFNEKTTKFISGWVLNERQYDEYLNNNNII